MNCGGDVDRMDASNAESNVLAINAFTIEFGGMEAKILDRGFFEFPLEV